MADEKTEAPTPRHLAELRRRGEVAQSAELTMAVTFIAAVYLLGSRLPAVVRSLEEIMYTSFRAAANTEWTTSSIAPAGSALAGRLAEDWLPFFMTIMGIGIVSSLAQTRGLISFSRLAPDLGRINPLSGLQRVFSKQGLMETGKGVIKMAVLGIVLYRAIKDVPAGLAVVAQAGLVPAATFLGDRLSLLARQSAMLLLLAAGFDYFFILRQHQQRVKMTRQEVMEDMKSAEGQPLVRAKIRQMQRRWSRQRMMQQIAYADVVVTNPTHLAIALRYDGQTMGAPVILAKGQGLVAEQIVRRARDLRIPIVQNIPLAHALIHLDLNAQISPALYQAVAEVLAFVFRLRRKGMAS